MLAVDEIMHGQRANPPPDLLPCRTRTIGKATEHQIAIRSLAEQLVCEANAILGDDGDHVRLEDEVGPGHLSFRLRYRQSSAEVSVSFAGDRAVGRIVCQSSGVLPGCFQDAEHELADADAVGPLLLQLLANECGT